MSNLTSEATDLASSTSTTSGGASPNPSDQSRDALLVGIRPDIPVDTDESRPVEQFQHDVLRPILKFLNPVILDLVAQQLSKYGTGFASMDRPDQIRRVENLLGQDSRLKRTLLGMVMGHFTQSEFAIYLQHDGEVRRRMVELVTERVRSQIGEVVQRVDAGQAD